MNCNWAQERLELYLDAELPKNERSALEVHLRICAACCAELETARKVQETLRILPAQAAPEQIIEAVYAHARADLRARRRTWLQSWTSGWRPVLGVAVAAILLIFTTIGLQDQEPNNTMTPAEIARAKRQVKWTIAYLSQVGRRTGSTVRDEVIGSRVVRPIHRSMQ